MAKKTDAGTKWAMTAGLVILAMLFVSRGGLASLGPMLRLALPVIVVVVVYRMVKKQLKGMVDDAVKRQQLDLRRGPPPGPEAPQGGAVIDLCPKCGAYMRQGHRC